jgi:aspartate/methionine/tyrosine aminotransferase
MKIRKLIMEDWLADYQHVDYNLGESGFVDFTVDELMELSGEDIRGLGPVSLINPDTRGSLELREQIQTCYHHVRLENILVTVGVTEALFTFFNTLLEPGDEVIVEYPEFQTLYELPSAIGCDIRFLNLTKENGYKPTAEEIEAIITSKTKLIIINNPHNPTGTLIGPEEIRRICDVAKKHHIFLLFDEHYKFLPLTKGTELIESGYDICRKEYDKIAATSSITKCFGLNGLRVGWLIAEPTVIEECREFKHYLTHVTPPVCDYLAYIALKNRERILPYVKSQILANVEKLNEFMGKHNHYFDYQKPQGGLVCFPGLKKETNSNVFCRELLEKHHVSLLPGTAFGIDDHFRINYGVKTDYFKGALEGLNQYLG